MKFHQFYKNCVTLLPFFFLENIETFTTFFKTLNSCTLKWIQTKTLPLEKKVVYFLLYDIRISLSSVGENLPTRSFFVHFALFCVWKADFSVAFKEEEAPFFPHECKHFSITVLVRICATFAQVPVPVCVCAFCVPVGARNEKCWL